MTVSNSTNRTSATGTGSTGQEVPFSFPISVSGDLTVLKRTTSTAAETTLTETTNYTVVINDDIGGTVTTVTAIETTEQIHIIRDTPVTQTLDLEQGGLFNAENVEAAFDKNTRLIAENTNAISRMLRFPETDPTSSFAELDNSVDRASKYLFFDSSGIPTAASVSTTGALTVSAYIETLLDDATAAAARSTLGALSVINVTDAAYGADPTGATDSTAAIQAALDAAIAAPAALYLPTGIYKLVTSALTVVAGQRIYIFGDGPGLTRIYQSTVDVNVFELGDSTGDTSGWYLGNMSIATSAGTGNAGGTGFAVQLQRMNIGFMENVWIPGCGGTGGKGGGISFDDCITWTFINVHVSNTLPDVTGARTTTGNCNAGFYFDDEIGENTAATFLGCQTRGCNHGYLTTDSAAHGVVIIGGDVEGFTWGIKVLGGDRWKIKTWLEGAPVYLEDCVNVLIDTQSLSDANETQTALQLVNCTGTYIQNTHIGGIVLVDSDCINTNFTNVMFAISTSLRNDSVTTRLENCFIGSATGFRATRAPYVVTRNFQIDNGVGSFENWDSATLPNGWIAVSSPTIAQEFTIIHSGTKSCKITSSGSDTEGLYFLISDAYKNCWISIEGFVYSTTISSAGPRIAMGPESLASSTTHIIGLSPTTDKWIPLRASFYKASGALERLFITTSTDGDVFYLDSIRIWAEVNPDGKYGDLNPENVVVHDGSVVTYEDEIVTYRR